MPDPSFLHPVDAVIFWVFIIFSLSLAVWAHDTADDI